MPSSGKKSSGSKTVTRPRRRAPSSPPWDPNAISSATRDEVFPFAAAGVVLGFLALLVCYSKNYLLLYGDAVAHLGIARRIVDCALSRHRAAWWRVASAAASADVAIHRQHADVADGLRRVCRCRC